MLPMLLTTALGLIVVLIALLFLSNSIKVIGPTEVGLVTKRIGKKLPGDNPIALNGEAGYQADLLMPGLKFVLWPIYSVKKFPWAQVPAGEIGLVISQVGKPLPIGAKSAKYKKEFGSFTNVRSFLEQDGEKGVQRPVLSPGSLVPIHPVAFLVITKRKVYGQLISPELLQRGDNADGPISCSAFGLEPKQLDLVRIQPKPTEESQGVVDMVGIVTTYEGDPLPSGLIASRLGDFDDVKEMEGKNMKDAEVAEVLLGNKNDLHNNYQDYQAFLEHGGKIGLQHDPLLYGAYALNPFLVRVEMVPMLIVRQGEVAVIKGYVGLSTEDTSGEGFKFGSLVKPGHRGIWREPLRTGKYPVNPRIYQAEIVPTSILTLNWAEAVSQAHNLDRQLSQIQAKSREGFIFRIDLQVQIHVPDTKAPRVISTVGTMQNLVNEVLQAAVGNHFRDKLQSMEAVKFIEQRQAVQLEAEAHIKQQLEKYEIETKGVYIQDVIFPEELVVVLKEREIANQEIATYKMQQTAETTRIDMEKARGQADMQAELASSEVGVVIQTNNANARKQEAAGEAAYIRETGAAKGAEVESIGLAHAKAYASQVSALGQQGTMFVNIAASLAGGKQPFMPKVLVGGGNGNNGSLDGLFATLIEQFQSGKLALPAFVPTEKEPTEEVKPAPAEEEETVPAGKIMPSPAIKKNAEE
ncbi:MAG: hypothetical protein HGA31_02045 [Candidatus Moranbacteria bacterium]|nr:hypothetical protein [Candidatus Moranbacteria bacterium]